MLLLAAACSSGSDGPGASGGHGGKAQTADPSACGPACEKILSLCPSYDSTWASACTRSCEIKASVRSELAAAELACIEAAGDCATATQCVSDIPGTGNTSGGSSSGASGADQSGGSQQAGGSEQAGGSGHGGGAGKAGGAGQAGGTTDLPEGGQAGANGGTPLHEAAAIRVLGFSPDGAKLAYLVCQSKNTLTGGDLWLWDFSRSTDELIEKGVRADTVSFVLGGTGLVYLQGPQNVGLFDDAGTLRYYDSTSSSAITLGEYTPSQSIAVSPDGNRVAFSNDYGKVFNDIGGPIQLHDLTTGSTLELASDYFNKAPVFSPDSTSLFLLDSLMNVQLWDLPRETPTNLGFASKTPTFSAKGGRLFFISGEKLIAYDLASGMSKTIATDADSAAMSPTEDFIAYKRATSATTADLELCPLPSGSCAKVGAGNLGPFSSDGARLALLIAGPGQTELHLRDLGAQTDTLIAQKSYQAPYFSSDGAKMLFLSDAVNARVMTLSLWSVSDGATAISTTAAGFPYQGPFLADDRTILYLSYGDTTAAQADLYAADVATLAPVRLGQHVSAEVYPSPNRKCLVFQANYDSNSFLSDLRAVDLSKRPLPSSTVLDRGVEWDVAVSAERAAYVVDGKLYASPLPCSE